jgi:hypothetical protein
VLLEGLRLESIKATGVGSGWSAVYYVVAFIKVG